MNTLKDKLNNYSTLLQEPDKVSINTTRDLLSETDLLMANITKFFTPISDEQSKKSSEIATILGKMATPFGPIPINFFYLLYLFPAAMGAILFILIFRFKDLIGFQRVLKNNYKNKDFGLISDLAEYVKLRTPSLFDGESRLNRWIVLCIPIAIFGTSVTINIKLILLSNSIQMSLLDNTISIISIVLGGLMIGISLGYASIEFKKKIIEIPNMNMEKEESNITSECSRINFLF